MSEQSKKDHDCVEYLELDYEGDEQVLVCSMCGEIIFREQIQEDLNNEIN